MFFNDNMATPGSDSRYTSHSTIGRFINTNGETKYPLIGLIYGISIYNTWNDGGPSNRPSYVILHKDSYSLYFNLTDMDQNTNVDGLITK